MLRVGDGAAVLVGSAAPGFIEKYDLTGAMIGTPIALPTATAGTQRALTFAGNSVHEGALSLSADGHYAVFAGFDAAPGTAGVASTAPPATYRVIGRIDAMGNVDTSTVLDMSFSGGSVRAAATSDGIGLWVSGTANGNGGVWYTSLGMFGNATHILATPNNMRWLGIFGGQLYGDSGSANFTQVFAIGMGLPKVTGQTAVLSPGMPTTGASPSGLFAFDLNPNVAGIDTIYVGDDGLNLNAGGIEKWTFDGTTWTKVATFLPIGTVGFRAVTGFLTNGVPTLIAVSTHTPTRIYSVVDDGSATPVYTLLMTSAANTVYRGVTMAPQ